MPVIFGDKKKMGPVAVNMQQDKPSSGDDLKALAESILHAIKSNDAAGLAQALKSFHLGCEEYTDEE